MRTLALQVGFLVLSTSSALAYSPALDGAIRCMDWTLGSPQGLPENEASGCIQQGFSKPLVAKNMGTPVATVHQKAVEIQKSVLTFAKQCQASTPTGPSVLTPEQKTFCDANRSNLDEWLAKRLWVSGFQAYKEVHGEEKFNATYPNGIPARVAVQPAGEKPAQGVRQVPCVNHIQKGSPTYEVSLEGWKAAQRIKKLGKAAREPGPDGMSFADLNALMMKKYAEAEALKKKAMECKNAPYMIWVDENGKEVGKVTEGEVASDEDISDEDTTDESSDEEYEDEGEDGEEYEYAEEVELEADTVIAN